jgi:predicted nucleotidyltransferase
MKRMQAVLTPEQIRERLTPLYGDSSLQLVLLFGSVASQRTRPGSDIDLAFLFDSPIDILSLTNRVIRLLHADNVDVVDLHHAAPLLKYSVARTGKVVYERRPGVFAGFCSLAFRMYADTKKLRDARERAIKGFLSSRGLA